jgi:hypothetical protein
MWAAQSEWLLEAQHLPARWPPSGERLGSVVGSRGRSGRVRFPGVPASRHVSASGGVQQSLLGDRRTHVFPACSCIADSGGTEEADESREPQRATPQP